MTTPQADGDATALSQAPENAEGHAGNALQMIRWHKAQGSPMDLETFAAVALRLRAAVREWEARNY